MDPILDDFKYDASDYASMNEQQRLQWRRDNFPRMSQSQLWEFYWSVINPLEKSSNEETLVEEFEHQSAEYDQQIRDLSQQYVQIQHKLMLQEQQRQQENELFTSAKRGADNEFSD